MTNDPFPPTTRRELFQQRLALGSVPRDFQRLAEAIADVSTSSTESSNKSDGAQ